MVFDPSTHLPARRSTEVMISSYFSLSDPADDPANFVLPGKRWTQINAGGEIIAEKIRNPSNTAWIAVPNLSGLTGDFIRNLLGITTLSGVNSGDQVLSGKADLVNGKIIPSQLPAISINESFPVASQNEMLALEAQIGDVAIRTDLDNKKFLLLGADASVLSNWKDTADTTGGALDLNGLIDVELTNPVNDDFIQRKSGVFINRSLAQIKADLQLSGVNSGDETLLSIQNKLVSTDNLPEGATNKYFTSQRVLENILTGLTDGANAAIAATDTVITAFSKLQTQINNIVSSGGAAVTSVNGQTGAVVLTADHISDSTANNKFTSAAEKAFWHAKEPAIAPDLATKYWRGDKTFQTLDKVAVGLPNVPNVDATDRSNHSGTQPVSSISGLTASRLLGRFSGGFGPAQEISLGEGLSVAGGVLTYTPAIVDDKVDVRKHLGSGQIDITAALSAAMDEISNGGINRGEVYIPKGVWDINANVASLAVKSGITFQGAGGMIDQANAGTRLRMTTNGAVPAFSMTGTLKNIEFKGMTIDLRSAPLSTFCKISSTSGNIVYGTFMDDVCVLGGAAGIDVFSPGGEPFECALNEFHRCWFVGQARIFKCNTNNSGFEFNNCYYSLPLGGKVFDIKTIGFLLVKGGLAVGGQHPKNLGFASDGSTLLYYENEFNAILIEGVQMENIEFAFDNGGADYLENPVTYRDCLVQGKMRFNKSTTFISDNNRYINFAQTTAPDNMTVYPAQPTLVDGTGGAYVHFYQVVKEKFESRTQSIPQTRAATTVFSGLTNPFSRIIDPNGTINGTVHTPSGTTGYREINASRGSVNLASGASSIVVYNNLVTPNSFVRAHLMTNDVAASVKSTECYADYFVINMTQAVTGEKRVGFVLET